MRVIAHRGNLDGPVATAENSPTYVMAALSVGYEVEVDVWHTDHEFRMGHDTGLHLVSRDFLCLEGLLVHCKNAAALNHLRGTGANFFWHQNDDYTVTSLGDVLINPAASLIRNGILLMPELSKYESDVIRLCAGVCTDHASQWKSYK